MSEAVYKCEHCGRDNFKSKRGLSKHKLEHKGCKDNVEARFGSTTDTKIAAACLPADVAHKPQACAAGSQNAMHCPDMSDGLGAKRVKCMPLLDKDFMSAWLMKAQSQLEQSQADNDLDADVGIDSSSYMQGIVALTSVLKGYLQTHTGPVCGSLSTSYQCKKKTKCPFYFMLDEALQPSRLFRRSHTDRSR